MQIKQEKTAKNEMRNQYKYAEKLMYDYTSNLIRLEILEDEYKRLKMRGDIQIQSYRERTGHRTRDPVAEYSEHLTLIETRMQIIKQRILPVQALIRELANKEALERYIYERLLDVLLYVYFGKNEIKLVAQELSYSIRTIYRWKRELVKMMQENANKYCHKKYEK